MLHRFWTTLAVAAACLCAAPAAPVAPAAIPDEPEPAFDAAPLPDDAAFARAARTDPLLMLRLAAKRYRIAEPEGDKAAIAGYTAAFHKRERIGGTLHPPEVIRVSVREAPFAVQMLWEQGARNFAEGTLYADGAHGGRMLVWLPALFGRVSEADPRGRLPRGSARYSIEEFGFHHSAKRALRVWTAADARGVLRWAHVGTRPVAEAGGRECHIVRRTCAVDEIDPFAAGEANPRVTGANRADAFAAITLYYDTRTWLQLGAELTRADGEPVGSYFFRDVVLNPVWPADAFTRSAFRR